MIALAIQLARLVFGTLTLITKLLVLLVGQGNAALGTMSKSGAPSRRGEAQAPHGSPSPKRRRSFTAPPRRVRRPFPSQRGRSPDA